MAADQTTLEGQIFLEAPPTPPGTITLEVAGSGNVAVYAHGGGTGVFGETEGVTATSGVIGVANGEVGVGVSALNPYGVGLFVRGKAQLASRSGRATVGAGRSFVDIDLRQKGGLRGTPLMNASAASDQPSAAPSWNRKCLPNAIQASDAQWRGRFGWSPIRAA